MADANVTTEFKPITDQASLEAVLKTQMDAKLTELGFDGKAQEVIHKRNEEAKANRERAEKAEAALKTISDEKKAADEAATLEKARLAAEAEKKANAEKPLAEQITKQQEAFDKALKKLNDEREQDKKEYSEQLKARDEETLRDSIVNAAIQRGVISEELVDLFDYKGKVTMEKGRVKKEELDAYMDSIVEAKPQYFKKKDDSVDQSGQTVRPRPAGKQSPVDAAKLDPKAFDQLEADLRSHKI